MGDAKAEYFGYPFSSGPLSGNFVTLTELTEVDVPSLWQNLDLPKSSHLWDYLLTELPNKPEDIWNSFKPRPNSITYAIKGNSNYLNYAPSEEHAILGHTCQKHQLHEEVIGVIGCLNIDLQNRELDIGGVIFSPSLQRTVAATEAQSLILNHVFSQNASDGSPLFRQVIWRCNSLNEKSRRAAQRLGFVYRDTIHRKFFVKGKWVDSASFNMREDRFGPTKLALKTWLDPSNFDEDGGQIESLETIRRRCTS